MRSLITRWRRVGRGERQRLVQAYVWLAIVDLCLRTVGCERTRRLLAPRSVVGGRNVSPETVTLARTYAACVDRAARRHFVAAQCLHRSLALQAWLARDGIDSEVRIGVRKDHGELRAHAWVEVAGCVVNDAPEAVGRFTALQSAEPATGRA